MRFLTRRLPERRITTAKSSALVSFVVLIGALLAACIDPNLTEVQGTPRVIVVTETTGPQADTAAPAAEDPTVTPAPIPQDVSAPQTDVRPTPTQTPPPPPLSGDPPATKPPTAVLAAPDTVQFGQSFILSGERSKAASPGVIERYRWSTADGAFDGVVETAEPTFEVVVDRDSPLPPGRHQFLLTVVDDLGAESQPAKVIVVVVQGGAPRALLEAPASVEVGQSIVLSGESSRAAPPGRIVQYLWSLVRGGFGPVETRDSSFELKMGRANTLPAGNYTFSLVVVDDSGNESLPSLAMVEVRPARVVAATPTESATATPLPTSTPGLEAGEINLTSTGFLVQFGVTTSGGGRHTSRGFVMHDSVGQVAAGVSNSRSYGLHAGIVGGFIR